MTQPRNILNRRQLFESALRYIVLAVLAVLGIAAWGKRRMLVRQGRCLGDGVCSDCVSLSDCTLPEARSAQESLSDI